MTDIQKKLQPEYKLHKRLMRQMGEAIREFNLISEADRVLVGLSGGKDSLALLQLMGEMMVHTNRRFCMAALHVKMRGVDYLTDVSYLQQQCDRWDIPLLVRETEMPNDTNFKRTPCFLCSWNRRKMLFKVAQEEEYNKIALGHHQDDILRTAVMNLSFNGTFSTMPVRLDMRKFPVSIIRPLAKMQEDDLRQWAAIQHFEPVKKVCPHDLKSHRTSVGEVMAALQHFSPEYRQSLWHALVKAGCLVEER